MMHRPRRFANTHSDAAQQPKAPRAKMVRRKRPRSGRSDQFGAGYNAGSGAGNPLSAFEMISYALEFQVGFVIGYAESEAVRQASSYASDVVITDLAHQYAIPVDRFAGYISDMDYQTMCDPLEDE